LGDILTEDLLEEMDGDMEDDSLGATQVSSGESSEKTALFKRLLGSKKRLLIILLIGIVLIGTLVGIWFFFFKASRKAPLISTETQAADEISQVVFNEIDKTDEIVFEDIIVLEPFERIRLKGNSAMGLISLNISLELIDHRYRKQVYSMQDRIRKIIMGQVREMRWLELRNPEGKIELKYELLKRINSLFPKVMVRNIYFTNLIMQ
jgi:flagellar FliL protein